MMLCITALSPVLHPCQSWNPCTKSAARIALMSGAHPQLERHPHTYVKFAVRTDEVTRPIRVSRSQCDAPRGGPPTTESRQPTKTSDTRLSPHFTDNGERHGRTRSQYRESSVRGDWPCFPRGPPGQWSLEVQLGQNHHCPRPDYDQHLLYILPGGAPQDPERSP